MANEEISGVPRDMNNDLLKKEDREKTMQVYKILRDKIIENELVAGTMLVERVLCAKYNWSRTRVRDSLRMLSRDGLVNHVPGYSAYVSYITHETISDNYDVREVLEGLSARLCAERISAERLLELENVVKKYRIEMEAKSYSMAIRLDIDIHRFLMKESRNKKLEELMGAVFSQSRRIMNLTVYTGAWAEETLGFHLSLFDAIKNRQPELAEDLMRKHIRSSKRHQIEQLHQQSNKQLS